MEIKNKRNIIYLQQLKLKKIFIKNKLKININENKGSAECQ